MKLASNLYAARCPFGPAWIQVFLVVGERALLVDTGVAQSYQLVLDLLAEAGLPPERVDYIVNTHAHWDHVGCNGPLAMHCDARVLAHPAGARWITHFATQLDEFHGAYPDIVPLTPGRRASYLAMMAPDHRVDVELREGDVIDLGAGVRLRVLEAPGHLASSVCLWDEENGTLLTGDSLAGGGSFGGVAQYDDVAAYRASHARLMALPIRTLAPAHFEVIRDDDCAAWLDESLRQIARQDAAVRGAVRQPAALGEAARLTAQRLGVPLTVQSVITVVAHLEELVRSGEARVEHGLFHAV